MPEICAADLLDPDITLSVSHSYLFLIRNLVQRIFEQMRPTGIHFCLSLVQLAKQARSVGQKPTHWSPSSHKLQSDEMLRMFEI